MPKHATTSVSGPVRGAAAGTSLRQHPHEAIGIAPLSYRRTFGIWAEAPAL